ncbi:MAG: AAA family ATPase [Lewinellaceae bacterium]|nr:AAA family ATPase [Saprospiraceae bacterium]MCB9337609.1 AAA family ATPase [Lewinellaceae bacterium]
MATENANKIKRLELENFTCFSKAEFDFSPAINVFIGENGTGKTHLLKVLYTLKMLLNGNFAFPFENQDEGDVEFEAFVESELENAFKVTSLDQLIRQNKVNNSFKIKKAKWERPDTSKIFSSLGFRLNEHLFIPPQEMLSWQQNFIGNNLNRESGFDKTWFDLAIALDRGILKGDAYAEAKQLVSLLEEAISAEVIRKDKKFYFRFHNNGQSEQEASVVAQGINKLGQIIYLILNGSIDRDTILFWDEPETGLNPKYITIVTKFLLTLANAGCQIFVSTHDYLLTHQLSLFAENRDIEENVPPMRFFALRKGENDTEVEAADTVAEIQNNAILDEYAAYHELQMDIASKRFQTT